MTKDEELWMTILGQALNAALADGKLPAERDTVAKAAPHVIAQLCDIYCGKQPDARPMAAALFDLTEALFSLDDEVVRLLPADKRQEVWTVITMLNQERRKNVKPTQPSDDNAAPIQAPDESSKSDESSRA